jgi:glycosyltransferase involved in cell wall biosynthesis
MAANPRLASSGLLEDRGAAQRASPKLRILALSSTFPNPLQPGLGIFVRSRLERVAAHADVRVIAPVGPFPFTTKGRNWLARGLPSRRSDGALAVWHPRFLCPPGGTFVNPFLMAARVLWPIARLRRDFPFQLIDSHFGYPDGIAAAVLAAVFNVPFTVTLRGNETAHARGFCKRRLLGWTFRRAACVITVSERLRTFAISLGADPARVKVIPNGIDISLFYPRDRAECRRKYGIPPDRKVILSAGALIERKGHHRIVRALKKLQERGVPVHLVIAGGPAPEGFFEPPLERLVTELGLEDQVQFLGHVSAPQMPELMSAADLLCLASTREGWPNVVHESLGCGTPVVATDIGGVPDMLPSETYGFVVPVDDQVTLENSLANALQRSWNREAIASWGRARSWDHVAHEVIDVMNAATGVATP